MTVDHLRRALHGDAEPRLRPLPREVADLLLALPAPPRLAAHLRAVHDTAAELLVWLHRHYPSIVVDDEAVLYGAASHDIGKVEHPAELTGPGHRHEAAGYQLLRRRGVDERLARFARTHSEWDQGDPTLEELIVSLADTIWKGQRLAELEERIVRRLAAATGQQPWEAYLTLDDALTGIAEDADARLAFQTSCPVRAAATD